MVQYVNLRSSEEVDTFKLIKTFLILVSGTRTWLLVLGFLVSNFASSRAQYHDPLRYGVAQRAEQQTSENLQASLACYISLF